MLGRSAARAGLVVWNASHQAEATDVIHVNDTNTYLFVIRFWSVTESSK
jgi:hypothetical protein